MKLSVRPAQPQDVTGVVELIQAFAAEVFQESATVTAEALLADGFGSVLEFLVAENAHGELCGFAAWEKTYDVLSGTRGGALLGFYVLERERGSNGGEALLNALASEVRAMGGTFLTGLGLGRADLASETSPSLPPASAGPDVERLRAAADLSLAALIKLNPGLSSLLPRR